MPPQCGAFSRDLQDKSQSPRYSPVVGGPWLQMTSALMSKPGFATIFKIPTGMLNHLGNETRADLTVQMYRLSFPLVVRICHKLLFWREIN